MTHHIKITPQHFQEVLSGRKNFEIRFNDRRYNITDIFDISDLFNGYIAFTFNIRTVKQNNNLEFLNYEKENS